MSFDPRNLIPDFNISQPMRNSSNNYSYGDGRDFNIGQNTPLNSSNFAENNQNNFFSGSNGNLSALNRAGMQLRNAQYGNPTLAKQDALRRKTIEKQIQLGKLDDEQREREAHWRNLGLSEVEIEELNKRREVLNSLPEDQRLSNLEAWRNGEEGSIPDLELNNDIENKDINYIKAKYGDYIASYAMEKTKGKLQDFFSTSMTTINQNQENSIFNPTNIAVGAVKGLVNLGKTAGDLKTLIATDSGSEERAKELLDREGRFQKYSDSLTNLQDDATKLDSFKRSNIESISERGREDILAKSLNEYLRHNAIKVSEQEADKLNWALTEINKELLVNGIGEQVPQLVLGAIAAKVGSAVINGASNKIVSEIIKGEVKVVKNTLKTSGITETGLNQARASVTSALQRKGISDEVGNAIGSTVGIGAFAGTQDAVSAGIEAYNTIANAEGSELQKIIESPNFIKLKEQNPELSDRDIQLMLAEEALKKAGIKSGTFTALSAGTLGSIPERMLANTLSKGIGKKALASLASPVSEGLSETGEEYINITAPRETINKVLGTDFYDKTDRYALNKSLEAGAIGAVSGGASVAGLARDGVKATLNKTAEVTSKIANKAKTNIEDKIHTEEQSNFNSVFGTSSYTDKDGNVVEGSKGILGKSFDESSFGSKYKELVEVTKENPLFKPMYDKHGSNNYTKVINDMYKVYSKARNTLENKSDIKPEEKQELEAYVQSFEQVQTELSGAILQDMLDSNKELASNFSKMNQLQQELNDENTTENRRNEVIDELASIGESINKFTKNSETIQKLYSTTLAKQLSPDENIKHQEISKLPQDITFLDDKDPKDYPTIFNSVKQGIAQIATKLKEGKITEEEAYAGYREAIRAISQLKTSNQDLDTKIKGILELFEDMRKSLNSIGRDFSSDNVYGKLYNILKSYKPKTQNEKQVFFEKFFGDFGVNQKYKRGLFDYVNNFFGAKANGTPFEAIKNLDFFYNSQVKKVNALRDMIKEMNEDLSNGGLKESYSYKTDFTTRTGETNKFTNIPEAEAYLNSVINDMSDFNEISQLLLQGKAKNNTTKLKEGNKQVEETKQNKENTVKDTDKKEKLPTKLANNIENSVDTPNEVNIWYSSNENRILSNLSIKPFTVKHGDNFYKYRSVEHFYQTWKSGKFDKKAYKSSSLKPKGEYSVNTEISDSVMKKGLMHAFEQNKSALKALLDTEGKRLTHKQDKGYWGKRFPELLTEVRDYFLDKNNNQKNLPTKPVNEEPIKNDSKLSSNSTSSENDNTISVDTKGTTNNDKNINPKVEEVITTTKEKNESKTINDSNETTKELSSEIETSDNIIKKDVNKDDKENSEDSEEVLKTKNLVELQDDNYNTVRDHYIHSFAMIRDDFFKEDYQEFITASTTLDPRHKLSKGTINKYASIENNVLTINIPLPIAKQFQKFGMNFEKNTFNKYVTVIDNNKDSYSDDVLASIIDKNQSSKELQDVLAKELDFQSIGHKANNDFIKSFKPIGLSMYQYFKGIAKGIALVQDLKDEHSSNPESKRNPRFFTFNFLSNLIGFTNRRDKGTVYASIPNKTVKGLINGTVRNLISNSGRSQINNLTKYLADKGLTPIRAFNISEELKNKPTNRIYQEIFDNTTQINSFNTYEVFNTSKEKFINSLGKDIFKELGLKFTKNTTNEQKETIIGSLGLEAYTYLLNNNLVQEYALEVDNISDGSRFIQSYVGFTWDNPSLFTEEQYNNLMTLVKEKGVEKADKERAYKALTDDFGSLFVNTLALVRNGHSEASTAIFGDINQLHGVTLTSKDEVKGKSPKEIGEKPENKDASSLLTTGSNRTVLKALETANSVAFEPDMMVNELYEKNPDIWKLLNGDLSLGKDIDKLPISEASKDALKSRNLRVNRSFHLIDTYFNMAKEKYGDLSKALFTFKHELMSNSRIGNTADLNPQSDKIIREMLNPVEFKLVENSDGTFNIRGTIKPKFKVTKRKNARTIEELVSKQHKVKEDYTGLLLTLAQAMGIKVEKLTLDNIGAKVLSEWNKESNAELQQITDLLWDVMQSENPIKLDSNMIESLQAFYNKYGTGSSRLAKTLMGIAKFMYQNTKYDKYQGTRGRGNLEFHLYLEADGIANGFYNIMKQFSTEISPTYIINNMRTGNSSLNVLVNQDLDKDTKGSAHIFNELNIEDIYETIASDIYNISNDSLNYLSNLFKNLDVPLEVLEDLFVNPNTLYNFSYYLSDHGMDNLNIKERENRLSPNEAKVIRIAEKFNDYTRALDKDSIKAERNTLRKSINNLITIGQIIMLGGTDNGDTALRSYMSKVMSGRLYKLSMDDVGNIKRGLAKLGVTPTMYGGRKEGITNQILSNLKAELASNVDNAIKYLEDIYKTPEKNISDEVLTNLFNSLQSIRGIAYISGLKDNLFADYYGNYTIKTRAIKMEDLEILTAVWKKDVKVLKNKNNKNNLIKSLNSIIDEYDTNKRIVYTNIKEGLGTLLDNVIRSNFNEHFKAMDFVLSTNEYLFQLFIEEFKEKSSIYMDNKHNDDSLTDTEKTNGFTESDIKKIMKNMKNIPVVGTAFSENKELINNLINYGNTLLKIDGKVENDSITPVFSNYGLKNNSYVKGNTFNVKHTSTNYQSAGASINTATVPSTEAMTLNLVQQALQEVGKSFLNVFDGLDADFRNRLEVGEGANRETFKVHSETNLFESLFHLFNRATHLDNNYEDDFKKFQIASLYSAVGGRSVEELSSVFEYSSADLVKNFKEFFEYQRTIKNVDISFKDFLNNKIDSVRDRLNTILNKIDESKENKNKYSRKEVNNFYRERNTLRDSFSNLDKALNQYLELDNLNIDLDTSIELLVKDITDTYIDLVSKNYAIRKLEENDLPQVINQFSGNNSGYIANIEKLTDTDIKDRFIRFFETFGMDMENPYESSEALAEFIKQDPELSSKFNEYYSDKREQLKPIYSHSLIHSLPLKKINTVDELIDAISSEELKNIKSDTAKVIAEISKSLKDPNMSNKVYQDLDEFAKAVQDKFNINPRTKKGKAYLAEVRKEANGKYVAGVGIYVNPNATIETFVHELIHSMNRGMFSTYYSNLRNTLKANVRNAIANIENNAKQFANRMLLDKDVLDTVQQLRELAIKHKNPDISVDNLISQFGSAKGTAIAVQYVFEELPKLGFEIPEVLRQQNKAIEEFTAYGLTESNMLRELGYYSGSKPSNFTIETDSFNPSDRTIGILKNYYRKLESQVAEMFGLSNTKNDMSNSALFGILSSYKILAEHVNNPYKLEINKVNKKVKEPDIFNRIESNKHNDYLRELTQDIKDSLELNTSLQNDVIAVSNIISNNRNEEAQDIVSTLRSSNLPMSIDEENAFMLMYASAKVAYDGNKSLESLGYKWLEDLSTLLSPESLNMSYENFNKIFNPMRSTPNKLAYMTALVGTNEHIRNTLDKFYREKPTKKYDKVKESLAYGKLYSKELGNTNLTKGADILISSIKNFDLRDRESIESKLQKHKTLKDQQEKRNQVARLFGDLTNSEHIENLVKALQSGRGESTKNDDMNSVFTEEMHDFISTYEKYKGRRTLIGTILRIIVGSISSTYKWYKAKNQNSTLLESVRQRTAETIPEGIRGKFDNLTKKDTDAIDNVLLQTNLHNVKAFSGINNKELGEILRSKSNSDFEKAKVSGYIRSELINSLGEKKGIEKYNQVMWQVKGLGELMVTKEANTANLNESHYILPNSRAIVRVLGLSKDLEDAVASLSSIYALDYVSQEHKDTLANLLDEQTEAFNEMLDSVEAMYKKSSQKNKDSVLGEDGFMMDKKDPLSDIQIVDPKNVEELQNLRKRGYSKKAELPTGHIVMHTNMSDSVRFTTGMFNLTDSTINGVDIITGKSIGSKALSEGYHKEGKIPVKLLMKAGLNENYYESLTSKTSRRVIINSEGRITSTSIDLPRSLENQLIDSTHKGIDAIGRYFGRVIEEDTNIESNQHAVDLLRDHYKRNPSDRKFFIAFDGKYQPKGKDIKSIKFAEEINGIYESLPQATKQYIENTGGVMIDMREVENIVGYNQASLADLWTGNSRLPEPVQKIIKGAFEIFSGVTGFNPVKSAMYAEKGLSEISSFTKDIILNRSVVIPVSNLVSNILHLWTAGVPYRNILPDLKEGLQLAKDYQKTSNKIAQIEFMLMNHKTLPNERAKLTNELQVMKEKLIKSPIRDLVDNGIFNSVTTLEVASDTDIDFSLWQRFSDKSGLTKLDKATEDLIGKNALKNLTISKGSATHNFFVQAMDYGDFVAKYVLYKDLTKRRGINKTSAMETIRDEFVNYTMNRGREFDWLNRVGLTWFLAYKLSIQKIIFRNLRRNFLRTLATRQLGKMIPDNPILDSTVIEQNILLDSSLDYQLSPTNIYRGLDNYIWARLL